MRFSLPLLAMSSCLPYIGTRLIAPLQSTMLAFDAGADTGAHGAAPLADGEFDSLFHGYRLDQLHRHFDVVPRHHHLHSPRQADGSRHVGGAHVELRAVA